MFDRQFGDDPEPSEPVPAATLFVPVRPGPAGLTVRLFRTPLGDRTAVAFTSPALLAEVLGAEQPWTPLSEPALRAMTAPCGVSRITVDPRLAAAPVAAHPEWHPSDAAPTALSSSVKAA